MWEEVGGVVWGVSGSVVEWGAEDEFMVSDRECLGKCGE